MSVLTTEMGPRYSPRVLCLVHRGDVVPHFVSIQQASFGVLLVLAHVGFELCQLGLVDLDPMFHTSYSAAFITSPVFIYLVKMKLLASTFLSLLLVWNYRPELTSARVHTMPTLDRPASRANLKMSCTPSSVMARMILQTANISLH